MVTFEDILAALYEIQGIADPNHPQTEESLRERMRAIFDRAGAVMRASGYRPD